ncbi:MAG: response regulator [Actinomycetota bacterium]
MATETNGATSILVVDDEPDVRFLLRMIFQGAGHSVVEARNGLVALDCVREAKPSVVVTDLMMPVMDGRELIERLRSDPQMAAVPILLISASPINGVGADAVLKKPFRSADLLALIQDLLEGRVE